AVELRVEFPGELIAPRRQIGSPFGQFIKRFGSKTIKKLRIDIFYVGDHLADNGAGFAGSIRGRAHAPEAMENDAGNGMHHGGEGGYGKNVASDFHGTLFSGAFDFLQAFGMGHRADVPDVEEDFAGLRKEQRGEFAVVGPSASDGTFVNGAGLRVEKKRDGGN